MGRLTVHDKRRLGCRAGGYHSRNHLKPASVRLPLVQRQLARMVRLHRAVGNWFVGTNVFLRPLRRTLRLRCRQRHLARMVRLRRAVGSLFVDASVVFRPARHTPY